MDDDVSRFAEERRREEIDELVGAEGDGWADGFAPGTFGCHELLDRVHLLVRTLDETILEHHACLANPEWFELAHRAEALLIELYQRVGREHL